MCGIVGILSPQPQEYTLRQMLALLRHRGPDQAGIYIDDAVGLGSARLSIIDLDGGQQPIGSEDGTLWIGFNGEIFNYRALRADLQARGRRFQTQTDSEVVLHLYEEYGADCLTLLNGQFALAIWDARQQRLFLARDRFGILPLFYTVVDGALIFASEIKALLADSRVRAGLEIDPLALDQIFTYWSTLTPRTIFKGIQDVPPGHFLIAQGGEISLKAYWRIQFEEATPRPLSDTLDEFRALLTDATRLRLHADVPVGAYLSGGLDSSTISALVGRINDRPPATFSISFGDDQYDESAYQRQMAEALGSDHHVVSVTDAEIGKAFPEVVWHAETPLLRTAPAPMFLLSERVRERGYKVVLTGEGADEFLAGYDLFKEAQIRRFWARQPDSELRPALLRRVYPQVEGALYLAAFFGQGLTDVDAFDYSHRPRWNTTARARRFFSADFRRARALAHCEPEMPLVPPEFARWDGLQRAQYLEATIFLPQYLLSSQGDRMAMAHSVEARYPFLDHRLVEFCNHLPSVLKLNGLQEKYLLKKLATELLPERIARRRKQPYRAPVQRAFFGKSTPAYVRELLSPQAIRGIGLFDMAAVDGLVRKIERGLPLGESDEMALAGILSTQLLHRQFVTDFTPPAPNGENIRVIARQKASV